MAQEKEVNDSKGLVKSSAVVGGMTFISRISGFLRDVVFANIFGASAYTDAFFISFKIPNFFGKFGTKTSDTNSYKSSFGTGVLAVAVATPCTAPFMGSALGLALTQPNFFSILIKSDICSRNHGSILVNL